ncbi:MAG: AAA family ATPase, partial [Bacteroidota bacterium]
MIKRHLQHTIENWLFRNKIIILYGARQVGKTTLAKVLLRAYGNERAYFNCEIPSFQELLRSKEPTQLQRVFGKEKVVVLDEAQFIPEIGQILKIIADHLPEVQIIATGSSSFELANRTSEALTGRALTFTLYPFSYAELSTHYGPIDARAQLETWLRLGTYPEIALANEQDGRIL